jgi:hypothetical protein
MWIYTSLIRLLLTYAALVWWTRTHLTQFGHIQRITCLGMTGCMSTTPTAAMETLLCLPPLQLVVEKEARHAAYRLHCSHHFKKSDWGHSTIFKMAMEYFPVLLAPSDSMLPLDSRLNSHTVSSKLVLQCLNSLQGLSIHKRVKLVWVSVQCGIIRNEEADGLAGVGSNNNFYRAEPVQILLIFTKFC